MANYEWEKWEKEIVRSGLAELRTLLLMLASCFAVLLALKWLLS